MRSVIGLGVVAVLTWVLFAWGPSLWGRATITNNYPDIDGVQAGTGYGLEPGAVLVQGDALCFRAGPEDKLQTCFGWVLAVGGDRVEVRGGAILVNGEAARWKAPPGMPDAGPLPIPAQHIYVVSTRHRLDSFAFGPIPLAAVRGKIADFP